MLILMLGLVVAAALVVVISANEIQVTGSLTCSKNSSAATSRAVTALNVTQTGTRLVERVMTIATTDTTLQIPEGTMGYAIFHNLDATNTVNLKIAAAGTIFASMQAGEVAGPFRIGSGITAPVAIALVASCQLEYLILEA